MDTPTFTDANRRATLLIVRIIWFALVLGQVGFGVVAYLSTRSPGAEAGQQPQLGSQMFVISLGVLIGAIGLGYFARNQSYKKFWQGHAVTPPGFFMGNLILFSALEGASFLSLVFAMTTGQFFPLALPAAVSLAVQVVNFPSALPMQSTPPHFAQHTP